VVTLAFLKKAWDKYWPGNQASNALLPLGPSFPLQTILLSDLVWCDSPQLIAIFGTLFKNLSAPNSHYCQQRAAIPNAAKNVLKNAPNSHHYYCSGTLYPTGWAAQLSEDISRLFFKCRETLFQKITRLFF
jgi:hypothetical protein